MIKVDYMCTILTCSWSCTPYGGFILLVKNLEKITIFFF